MPPGADASILVADDDARLLAALRRTRGVEAYAVVTARDGREEPRMLHTQRGIGFRIDPAP